MTMQLQELRPYRSMLLAEVPDGVEDPSVDEILDGLFSALNLGQAGSNRVARQRLDGTTEGEVGVGFIHFEERRSVTWTSVQLLDVTQHLALVAKRGRYVALCFSDGAIRSQTATKLGKQAFNGLARLKPLSYGILNSVFVKGPALTLWLAGTHKRTSSKADSKVLAGSNLRDALEPLGDQSYLFTAARSDLTIGNRRERLGVSPRGSSIWAGLSPNWTEFLDFTQVILGALVNATPEQNPLPVLASLSPDLQGVDGPFDMAFTPPILLDDDPTVPADQRAEQEYWALHTSFRIVAVPDASTVECEVELDGQLIGTLRVALTFDGRRIQTSITGQEANANVAAQMAKVLELAGKPEWLRIWYSSGHTFMDGMMSFTRFRDFPFSAFDWRSFAGSEIRKEKPTRANNTADLTQIGTQDSLFCWVLNEWLPTQNNGGTTGWLACDDGAGEIADFIHFDDINGRLTLIHVKASSVAGNNREISTSDFEIVTAQALKNLRFVDAAVLADGLSIGLGRKINSLVWHDGQPVDRAPMLSALGQWGSNVERRLIVLQPRITRSKVQYCRTNPTSPQGIRMRQLDTLLLSATAQAVSLGTSFQVIGDQI